MNKVLCFCYVTFKLPLWLLFESSKVLHVKNATSCHERSNNLIDTKKADKLSQVS